MGEGHARTAYIVEDGDQERKELRIASLDSRFDLTKVFKNRRELFEYIVWADQNLKPLFDVASPMALAPGEEFPVIKPIFGKSDFKDTPENLDLLRRLSETMYGQGSDGSIPAGYTYLSQFVAHELCRSEPLDPGEALNHASFAIDLDSIYRGMPRDGLKLGLGGTTVYCAPFDIRRAADGSPLIGNTRNDANLALSQLHCAVVSFHNAVADSGLFASFEAVRDQVILCFQKMLIEDWLPVLTSKALVDRILAGERYTVPDMTTLCPAEAVLAGFRFGHSMARREYERWNGTQGSAASIPGLLRLTFKGGGLDAGRLRWDWPINWFNFFKFDDGPAGMPMFARRIDTTVDDQLSRLDQAQFQIEKLETSLAYRTLWFGAAAQIRDGWTVQCMLADKVGSAEFPMQPHMLAAGRPDLAQLFADGSPLAKRPPLWWFVLREAELFGTGGGLAGVGARLVAETVIAAIEVSTPSVLRGGAIHPGLPGGAGNPASMTGLLQWGGQPRDWYVTGHGFHC